jgi:hypothetical protein
MQQLKHLNIKTTHEAASAAVSFQLAALHLHSLESI